MKRETHDSGENNQVPIKSNEQNDDPEELRRGPWTLEEDTLLIHYVACHGEGRWNSLAKSAGLKRTGKSCRLRWLNYLKPDIKRGNLSPQEQLLILELHSMWGNRWSKIAANLPGRTDNEIKNYWRTRVQKQARQLNMESNSQSFIDAIRCYYMPRLVQKIEQNSANSATMNSSEGSVVSCMHTSPGKIGHDIIVDSSSSNTISIPEIPEQSTLVSPACGNNDTGKGTSLVLDDCYSLQTANVYDLDLASTSAMDIPFLDCDVAGNHWLHDDMAEDSVWDFDELWHFRK